MNYMKIKKNDTANGEGVRVSLFVAGCEFRCKNCFNPESWNFQNGQKLTMKEIQFIKDELAKPYISGLTFLGGEPLHPRNVDGVARIIMSIKKDMPEANIWVYSGFVLEDLIDRANSEFSLHYILKNTDVLVDGLFVQELHDPSLEFRGSSNQRILNLKELLVDTTYESDEFLSIDENLGNHNEYRAADEDNQSATEQIEQILDQPTDHLVFSGDHKEQEEYEEPIEVDYEPIEENESEKIHHTEDELLAASQEDVESFFEEDLEIADEKEENKEQPEEITEEVDEDAHLEYLKTQIPTNIDEDFDQHYI